MLSVRALACVYQHVLTRNMRGNNHPQHPDYRILGIF